jgi:hypothetical protein
MNKLVALLTASLLAFIPMSAQATPENPTTTASSFNEWLKAGEDNGWVVDNKIVEQVDEVVDQPEVPTETAPIEKVEAAKALVIVDSYFDSSKISGDVVDVCIARIGCELTPTPIAGVANSFNHGTAMADLARKANPEAKLILIRAASATKNPRTNRVTMAVINGNDFLNSLRWVASSSENVSAVSFSYTISGNMKKVGDCRLSTVGGVNVSIVDPQIRSSISNLKNAGIPVFAGTGNDSNRKPVAYPACIPDVMSVAAGVGDSFIPSSNRDANTDFVGALPANTFNYTSSIFGVIPQTTSSATASVAGLWSRSMVEGMWVRVSR